ncbi:MAG: hypothetical protein JWO19_4511 [Bryobacterales bacterium]|nr:hypothetical protein [Bryobacterales bacterium]
MMRNSPLANPSALPNHTPMQICVACAEGDHEQVLRRECCKCPCHGVRPKADEVAA